MGLGLGLGFGFGFGFGLGLGLGAPVERVQYLGRSAGAVDDRAVEMVELRGKQRQVWQLALAL